MAKESERGREKARLRPEEPTAERLAAAPGALEDAAQAWPLPAWVAPEAWEPWAAAVPRLVWAPWQRVVLAPGQASP